MILDIIIKYWVQQLCAGAAGIVIYFVKKYWTMHENEQRLASQTEHEKIAADLSALIKEEVSKVIEVNLQQQKEIDSIREGVLDMQGSAFKRFCRMLLDENHIITIEEAQQCAREHKAYQSLHGNSDGDLLFNTVEKKAENDIIKNRDN